MRLLLGVLAGQDFAVTLVADESLSKRPMRRVIAPLRLMGAKISAQRQEYPPITIQGGNLKQVTYKMPLASSQVKSALLLAGLYCDGITKIIEPVKTRDHTERMLKLFGAQIKIQGSTISIKGKKELESHRAINIPADISSATFFMVAAAILPGSSLVIKSVGLNPTRMGAIQVLKRMGADIKLKAKSEKLKVYEPVGDIIVKGSNLKGVRVRKEEIPSLIDEVPVLMVAACFACGQTVFEGVGELRVKETDRINSMMRNLQKMGAKIQVKYKNSRPDIFITGTKHLVGAKVSSFGDHRTAMSMAIAGLAAKGQTVIDDVGCISKSFPGFIKVLKALLP
jgi:3-phosphoshikimate 1-carboxyvinyltransferase